MSIENYLSQYKSRASITLVGPFYNSEETLVEPVIYVDGGTAFRDTIRGVSLGDGDSFPGELDVKLNPDKDFSDLAVALANVPQHFTELKLYGFLGGRRDHELFNFGEAHHFLKSRNHPTRLQFDDHVMVYSSGSWNFSRHGSFSLAVLEQAKIKITGDCLYQCAEPREFQPLSSLGLSNAGNGAMLLECDQPTFVIFEEPN